jgi:hypothetical protein
MAATVARGASGVKPELFDGKRIVYRVVTVDYNAKIYGVNYAYEEI